MSIDGGVPEDLPFIPVLPEDGSVSGVSFRGEKGKRPTLWFLMTYKGHTFRLKEFFMDWFYTGFPKSLMKTLVDSYGSFHSTQAEGTVIFTGLNYKGLKAASLYTMGTTVEMECRDTITWDGLKSAASILSPVMNKYNHLRSASFAQRSYLASGGAGAWWEDRRISSLAWNDVHGESFRTLPCGLHPSSMGSRKGERNSSHRILVLSDGYFKHVAWVDIADINTGLDDAVYRFRPGGDLFTISETGPSMTYSMGPGGPWAIQAVLSGKTVTVALSPGTCQGMLDEIAENMLEIADEAEGYF